MNDEDICGHYIKEKGVTQVKISEVNLKKTQLKKKLMIE